MSIVSLYWNTVRYMKPSQVYYRVRKTLGMECSIGCEIKPISVGNEKLTLIAQMEKLDFDPVFLARFPVEELMQDHVCFLHQSRKFSWDEPWCFPDETPLWNFNLHYFEYLFPLVEAYRRTGNRMYYEKIKTCVEGWIKNNPRSARGNGWAPYTVALRLTNWLSCFSYLYETVREDKVFYDRFINALYEQYVYLSGHLEKDLLGNHYFEDLKALILCALFFQDEKVLSRVLLEFKKQCNEQILPDGMHFELSPMYHKIIFEGMLRVAAALRAANVPDLEIEKHLQPMLDAAYSMEYGLERLPLFNDCGNNVAKSLEALCEEAKNKFHLLPVFKKQFPNAGYYILEENDVRVIVDAGEIGPQYLAGHVHCDALSFEVFFKGKPVLVNCGTYAYQDALRPFFRSTLAHNTVRVDRREQSSCWGTFRTAKRQRCRCLEFSGNLLKAEMTDQANRKVIRTVELRGSKLTVCDHSRSNQLLEAAVHVVPCARLFELEDSVQIEGIGTMTFSGERKREQMPYAPEYGAKKDCAAWIVSEKGSLSFSLTIASI